MKIQQIAIFMENKPGHLQTICRTLADAGVSITTLSLADTQQYGILRLLTDNPEKAATALSDAGFVVNQTEVLAVEVDDKPGGLLRILDIISEKNINIEYMYAFTFHRGENAVMVFRFDKPDDAISALPARDVKVLTQIDILKGAFYHGPRN
ncbi:MAG: ACT domain-containing protein [Planctomycetes bacterium]|nr:ACT domain-containing protein [Planctomycetota bacterium]